MLSVTVVISRQLASALQPAAFGNPCESLRCPWLCVVVPRASSASSFADLLTAANHREGWSATEWEDRVQARCLCPEGYTTNADYDAQVLLSRFWGYCSLVFFKLFFLQF